MTTLDAFTRSGYLVYGTAPNVRRRVPGTRLWQVWNGTGWTDDAATTAPVAVPVERGIVTRRWVEPEIVPEAPRTAVAAAQRSIRPYDPERLTMVCVNAHMGQWQRRASGTTFDCVACKRDYQQRYRKRQAAEAG